jgi:hypothetical protein
VSVASCEKVLVWRQGCKAWISPDLGKPTVTLSSQGAGTRVQVVCGEGMKVTLGEAEEKMAPSFSALIPLASLV